MEWKEVGCMWISKKRFETLEKEVAALKKEQPLLRELMQRVG